MFQALKNNLNYRHWPFFLIFLTANSLLSYVSLSIETILWVVLLGLALPLIFAFVLAWKGRFQPSQDHPVTGDFPSILWFLFIPVLFFTHFFRLTTFPAWPLMDEGLYAFLGAENAEKWDWRLLWGESQSPSLTIWWMGLFFKLIPVSFLSLRLFTTLLSLLTVGVGYLLARRVDQKEGPFTFCWILGLSFWPFSLSRLCGWGDAFLFLEMICFFLILSIPDLTGSFHRWKTVMFLSFVTALGVYAAYAGIILAVWVTLAMFFFCFISRSVQKAHFFTFLALYSIMVLPMVLTLFGSGGHARIDSQIGLHWNFWYPIVLFWNGLGRAPFAPAWGGCFNSILGSLVGIGVLELFWRRKFRLLLGLAASFSLFLSATLFSEGIETFRVLGALPFMVLLATFGLKGLISDIPPKIKWPLLVSILMASSAMDLYHYAGPFQDFQGTRKLWRNADLQNIYPLLRTESEKGSHWGSWTLHPIIWIIRWK